VPRVFKIRVTSSLGVAKETLTPHAKTAGEARRHDQRLAKELPGKAGCHAIGQIRNDGSYYQVPWKWVIANTMGHYVAIDQT